MIWDWFAQWPAFLAAALVIFAPGAAIGAALRLRGLALWALAPVGSVALLAALAVVLERAGIPWNPVTIALSVAATTVVAWLVTIPLGRAGRDQTSARSTRLLLAGLAVGALLGAMRLGFYVGVPDAISQTNDAIFHLNALQWIVDSESASSLTVSGVIGASSFYPAAWHAVASATMLFSGAEIPVVANMVGVVIVALVWPIGVAWFTRAVVAPVAQVRGMRLAPAFAAALSGSLLTFPLMLFQWGVLYPNALSLALVPAAAAVVLFTPAWIAGEGPVSGRARGAVVAVVAVLAGLAALALAQPSSLLAWASIVVAWFVAWSIARLRRVGNGSRVVLVIAAAGSLAGFAHLWQTLAASTSGSHWPPFQEPVPAVIAALTNSQLLLPLAPGISILMLVGVVVVAWRVRLVWLAVVWAGFSALYVVVATNDDPEFRAWLLGAWYADPYRVAALAALAVIPLAAIGLAGVMGWIAALIARRTGGQIRVGGWTVGATCVIGVVGIAMVPVVQMPQVTIHTPDFQTRYALNERSFLSPEKRELLERIDDHVADDAIVIANPSTGSAFGYMLSGREVFPKTWSPPRTEPWDTLAWGLRDAAERPEVCEALDAFGHPEYVLDFGMGEASPGRWEMPGMTDFDGQAGFELVDREGDASLWRITACAR